MQTDNETLDDLSQIANPLTVGMLNGSSAFLLDEKYYLDQSDENKQGLIQVVKQLGETSREEIITGALNLYFKSNEQGIPDKTRGTIRVILPELRKFSREVQSIVGTLLRLSDRRNDILDNPPQPLKLDGTFMDEASQFKETLGAIMHEIIAIYDSMNTQLDRLIDIADNYRSMIRYAFFFLKRDTYKTKLEDDINYIQKDYQVIFHNLKQVTDFKPRLSKRIEDLRSTIYNEIYDIEIQSMMDF